ncbi:LysR family transcriptional regulator [Cochlodiniinecator piscidefendens]|uniref:LysR family transcriptional regulator n=1 Tax=Cochlodiniinecator piscidefendens TaxID=2715756 RepID=UPI001407FC13|nr:LysR family transcriptional regulator [Cochlodiniinecator piscidefendens]
MIDLTHLNAIATICDTGSFQLASEKLNKARSAVSYSVKQVEERFQIQIFDRSTYRPTLTPDGKALLPQIRLLLSRAGQFDEFVQDLKGEGEIDLRLGVSSNFPIRRLTGLLKGLKQDFPITTVHLNIETASGERQVMAGNVDIAIFAAPSQSPFLDYQQIGQMEFPLVAAPSLLGAESEWPGALTKPDLARFPQVVVKSSDEKAPDTGLMDEAQKWYVTDMTAKKELILEGLGWGRLPAHMVEQEINRGQLLRLPLLGDFTLPLYLVKRANHPLGPAGRSIWRSPQDLQ